MNKPLLSGRTHKNSSGGIVECQQDFEQVVIVPAGHFSLSFGGDLFSPSVTDVFMVLDHVQRYFANEGKVLGCIAGLFFRVILCEDHIQCPVQIILYLPVRFDGVMKVLSRSLFAGDVVGPLSTRVLLGFPRQAIN
jgi:hypothetical protein